MFGKNRNVLDGGSKKKKIFFSFLTSLFFSFSFTTCFISGAFNSKVNIEESAEYFADVAKNYTRGGKYAALLVEPNDVTEKKLRDTGLELYDLHGIFQKNSPVFASTINADHSNNVYFKEIETNNLSFVYVTSGFNSVPYYDHYRHESYPLELMFKREKSNFANLLYISQTQANKILDLNSLNHSDDNYKSLLKKRIILTTNGVEKEWQIEDIYLEQNYFYDSVAECAGEFVFAFSPNGFGEGLKKQSLYFLSEYAYQNTYFLDYVRKTYPKADFNYKINTFNILDNYSINNEKLHFASNSKDSFISTLIICSGIITVVASFAIIYFILEDIKLWHHFLFAFSCIFPYLIFKLIYKITHRVLFFSSFATQANLVMIICCIFIYGVILLAKKRKLYAKK